ILHVEEATDMQFREHLGNLVRDFAVNPGITEEYSGQVTTSSTHASVARWVVESPIAVSLSSPFLLLFGRTLPRKISVPDRGYSPRAGENFAGRPQSPFCRDSPRLSAARCRDLSPWLPQGAILNRRSSPVKGKAFPVYNFGLRNKTSGQPVHKS